MFIRDVMTKEVISVFPDSSVEEVAQIIIKNRIHGVPVIEGKKLIGIITETDFFTKGSIAVYLPDYISFLKNDTIIGKISDTEEKKLKLLLKTKAKDIMSSPCITVNKDADVSEFLKLVKEKKLMSVPVVGNKKNLVGIITLADIINIVNIK